MLKIEKVSSNMSVKEDVISSDKSVYIFEPLYRGYGNTIGNTIRRILLSSVPGAAIKGVSIEGVSSEFSVVKGIKENVVDILLNVKGIIIALDDSEEYEATLSVKGPRVVKASDILVGSDIKIINPDHIIANITEDIELNMTFKIGVGEGFVLSEDIDKSSWEVGCLSIDAWYSPIRNVKFEVHDTMFGRDTNYNKLVMEVTTDGSIKPNDAMSYAVELLFKHLSPVLEIGNKMEHLRSEDEEEDLFGSDELLEPSTKNIKLEDMDLTVRSYNCLKKVGIKTIHDISSYTMKDFMKIKNLGKKSLDEIISKLKDYNIDITD